MPCIKLQYQNINLVCTHSRNTKSKHVTEALEILYLDWPWFSQLDAETAIQNESLDWFELLLEVSKINEIWRTLNHLNGGIVWKWKSGIINNLWSSFFTSLIKTRTEVIMKSCTLIMWAMGLYCVSSSIISSEITSAFNCIPVHSYEFKVFFF